MFRARFYFASYAPSAKSLLLRTNVIFEEKKPQVSDDDLLEILGQSRDPLAVQKHIKKCFEGFKAMEIIAPGRQLNRNHEAFHMRHMRILN